MVNRPQGSTVRETSRMATWAWGIISCQSIGLLLDVPTLEHATRGVKLSSNGLSSLGRWSARVGFGTSDPQELQELVNHSAALYF